jgi:hypothetical protein
MSDLLKAMCLVPFLAFAPQQGLAFDAGEKLKTVAALDGSEFEGASGFLKRSWMWDESDPSFVVSVDSITYNVNLDDGRRVSKRALECPQQELFGDANTGCSITFSGQYHIELSESAGSVSVSLTIWNVDFGQ